MKAIVVWPTTTTISEVHSFYGLATFYDRLMWNFRSIMAECINCMKQREFRWSSAAVRAFDTIRHKLKEAPALSLLDFKNVFEMSCDASNFSIGAVLS